MDAFAPEFFLLLVWWIFQHQICFGGVEIPLVTILGQGGAQA
jgi:hypothetical protein